ncbi:MAG: hypothetical protein JWM21_1699 [Acidobacteria bacterium]|nr:hypothetical protein [Acidobacteriota bacterium]
MSDEELNRKMKFIVEQQAHFSADIQVMREVHAADTQLLKEETKLLKEQYRNLSDAVTTVVGLVGGLAQGQAQLLASQTRTDEKLSEVAERLNIFIGVVERHLGGDGNKGS